jgi:DNA-binding transcriptional LysR family regulator
MDRLQLMTVFIAVAEEESFAGAGRRLRMSAPAVTRAIAALEDRLRVKLLHRTTRFVRATDAGRRYLEAARRVVALADEADDAAIGVSAAPRGHVAVTAPVLFGRMYVIPCIAEYLDRYPETTVSGLLVDRVVNLLEEDVDVAVRIGDLPDSGLKALRVGSVRRVICASPQYLARRGVPRLPADLHAHAIVAATSMAQDVDWRLHGASGELTIRCKPRLLVTSNDAAIEAALRGVGITRLISYQVAPQLASGELEVVLGEYEPPPMPIHVVHREGTHSPARIRAFIDLLAERLRALSALNGAPGPAS